MKGLELAKQYYEAYGKEMLQEQFPQVMPFLAIGLAGSGSECYGYDDATSRDHDFEPGFCIFLPGEELLDRRAAFLLERAYAKLPKEFEGVRRSALSPVGGARHGVMRTEEFFRATVGMEGGRLSTERWLTLSEQSLAEATNGAVFLDHFGEVTRLREMLASFPEDIRRKRLAGQLLLMAQSGQYNYLRCLKHGEPAAAQLAVAEFVKSTLAAVFLLNRVYRPYYKWTFRALRELPKLSELAIHLEWLLTTGNEPEQAEVKYDAIEQIASDVISELTEQSLTKANCGDLEKHAYSVNDGITDAEIRNLHILAAV